MRQRAWYLGSSCYRPALLDASQRARGKPSTAAAYTRMAICNVSNDYAIARRAGIRTRSSRSPEELLAPREREVIELIAQGFRNREIANALVISESTTKVHVRHVFEKLGVRTRAEAITRFNLYSD